MIAFRRDKPDGGKPGAEAASLTGLARDLQLCLVATQYVLDDCQPQTSAAGFTRPSPVYTIKSFRQTGDMFRFNPYAIVLYGEDGLPIANRPVQTDIAIFRRIADRVTDEVSKSTP